MSMRIMITMFGLCISLLFLELQIVEGATNVQITPCTDSRVEVTSGEVLTLNCKPLTQSMEWRLSVEGTSHLLAKLDNSRYVESNTFNNVFVASIGHEGILLTINSGNITDTYLAKGTVYCNDLTNSKSSNCELNYVYKPNSTSCTAEKDPSGDVLSCTIKNAYSSRGIYTCQPIREKDEQDSDVEELDTVSITTANEEGGVRVSGECKMKTTLPTKPGNYSYLVKISPGGRDVRAKLPGGGIWIEHDRISTSNQAAIYGVSTLWLVAALVLL